MIPAHDALIRDLGQMPTYKVQQLLTDGPEKLAKRVKPTMKVRPRDHAREAESTAGLMVKLTPKERQRVMQAAEMMETGAAAKLIEAIEPLMQTPIELSPPATSPS